MQCDEWTTDPTEAVAQQRKIAALVEATTPLPDDVRFVAACDVSFNVGGDRIYAALIVMDLATGAVVERQGAVGEPTFPYVPGLLSFREIPHVLAAWKKLTTAPDVIICDGQGIAHPRRVGIASHLGVCVGVPTVGCAKSRLCGKHDEPGLERGSRTPLVHRGETIGAVLRTRRGVAPVFVSPGHMADLESSVALVLRTATRYRLPDPIREAHRFANELRVAGPGAVSDLTLGVPRST